MRATVLLPVFIFICTLLPGFLTGQENTDAPGREAEPLSLQDQFVLSNVPVLELPESYKGPNAPLLPVSIDNSLQPYFRSITTQSGYECGQSAGVAFNFTYEIDRLRNVPASNANNQYPTHFVWDFLNNGDNYTGASFFDSWEIVRACGTMNVTDYGGLLNSGGYKRWISGYDAYFNGMKNRLTSVKAIRVDSPEGLQTLKYWLWDHLEGSPVGGVANFYAKYFSSVSTVFPAGTPEAGKYVQTYWSPSPTHAWTVCGFNDSVRYDYNNDGQYTNNIDITGDGVIDMHDWEKGGLKFANGYAGTGWCNQGFCYLMYKTLADDIGYGGIWEHTVYVVEVKDNCDPQLTMKVTLKHPSRNKLKVTAGVTTSLSSAIPDYILEFPIFNYQGGPYYMQGGSSEADKTIEFGLDLAPLLSHVTPGQMAKYFLEVREDDPANAFPGEIVQMALINYTGSTPQTILCQSSNVPLLNDSITRISVNHNPSFSKPSVTTLSLPAAQVYQPYSHQLSAGNGNPPYLWDVQLVYPENTIPAAFPAVTAQPLTVTNSNTGYAVKTLDFSFPFYQKAVNKMYIYADGFIVFDDKPYTYPYLVDPNLLFRQTAILCPFMTDLRLYYNLGDGIWYEGDATSATIRWKASINNMSGTTSLNFAVKLYRTGLIEYYYGNMIYPVGTQWTGGMSGGDNKNYQYSQRHNANAIPSGTKDMFVSCGYPVEMTLSEEGLFSGTPLYPYTNQQITFRVTDNNGISNTKLLYFTANGLLFDYTIQAGGDSLVEYGDTALISFGLTNLGTQQVTGATTWITELNPFITLLDSTEYVGTIAGGQTVTFPDAFTFIVSTSVPDHHQFSIVFHESSNQQSFETTLHLEALAPDVVIGKIQLPDGDNGRLDPGETTDMVVGFENHGGAKVINLQAVISSGDPLLTVNQGTGMIPLLLPDSSLQLTFSITASDQAPFEHLYLFEAGLSANNGYSKTDSIWLLSGEIIEDFETGTFEKFPWDFGGYANWSIDPNDPYEGEYAISSGWIYEDMESEVNISLHILTNGEISFWKRISCENDPNGTDNDYLAFFIDDQEMERWDGYIPWEEVSYPVSKGYHTFRWVYHKNHSVVSYHDRCWIDFVTFPAFEGALPRIEVNPLSFSKSLDPGHTATESLQVTNTGGGLLHYTVQVFDTAAGKHPQPDNLGGTAIVCSASSLVPGEVFNWTFTVNNASSDNEYLKHIRMDFPADVTVNGATNFSGGSLGDLVYDGTTGSGSSISWQGESAGGLGVIKPGETASTVITGNIEESSSFDVFIVYFVEGDQTGTAAHETSGEMRIANEGLSNTWLSLSSNTGNLLPGTTAQTALYFDAGSLSPGDYYCDLLVRDLYNNIEVVPVFLHVNWPLGIQHGDSRRDYLACYPNPFSQRAGINYSLGAASQVQIDIFTLQGESVLNLVDAMHKPGDYEATWSGTDNRGAPVKPGVYLLRYTTADMIQTIKLILIR